MNEPDPKTCTGCLLSKPLSNFRPRASYTTRNGEIRQRKRTHLCSSCRRDVAKAKRRCPKCQHLIVSELCKHCSIKSSRTIDKFRKQVIDHYGGECLWCGQIINLFLTVDHINNDGWTKRGCGGRRRWRSIITAGFPADLRILCHNCNSGRQMYGDELVRQAIAGIDGNIVREGMSRYQVRRIVAKQKVLAHYGHKCNICGVDKSVFLTIDHVGGGGREHRSVVGNNIALWLIRNGYPDGYRILCWNCNAATAIYGEDTVELSVASFGETCQ